MPLDEKEAAKLFYVAARAELIERMKLRDSALVLYATGVAAVVSAAFIGAKHEVICLLPFLSVVTAMIGGRHSEVVGVARLA